MTEQEFQKRRYLAIQWIQSSASATIHRYDEREEVKSKRLSDQKCFPWQALIVKR